MADKIDVNFTDVEIQKLSNFLGRLSVRHIVVDGSDSPYLIRAIEKVFAADEEVNGDG